MLIASLWGPAPRLKPLCAPNRRPKAFLPLSAAASSNPMGPSILLVTGSAAMRRRAPAQPAAPAPWGGPPFHFGPGN
eukprot:1328674-Pyramimonas_sp.AAC.1